MNSHKNDILEYPIQNVLTSVIRKEAGKQNCVDFMSMWAGQSVHLSKGLPATQLMQELRQEVVALLQIDNFG